MYLFKNLLADLRVHFYSFIILGILFENHLLFGFRTCFYYICTYLLRQCLSNKDTNQCSVASALLRPFVRCAHHSRPPAPSTARALRCFDSAVSSRTWRRLRSPAGLVQLATAPQPPRTAPNTSRSPRSWTSGPVPG